MLASSHQTLAYRLAGSGSIKGKLVRASSSKKMSVQSVASVRPVLKFPRRIKDHCEGTRYKTILSIDGGGLRGLIPAGVIEELEDIIKTKIVEHKSRCAHAIKDAKLDLKTLKKEDFDIQIADYFDVIAGTSTGAILATYLASRGEFSKDILQKPDVVAAYSDAIGQLSPPAVAGTPAPLGPPITLTPGSVKGAQAVFLARAETIFPGLDRAKLAKDLQEFIIGFTASWGAAAASFQGFAKALTDPAFVAASPWIETTNGLFKPKHPSDGVDSTIKESFGETTLFSKAMHGVSLLLMSFDLGRNRPVMFFYDDSAKDGLESTGFGTIERDILGSPPTAAKGSEPTGMDPAYGPNMVRVPGDFHIWEAVRASTAAPAFFPTASVTNLKPPAGEESVIQMCDGGVVLNNPSAAALTFAAATLEASKLNQMALLSIGCGNSIKAASVPVESGLTQWGLGPLTNITTTGAGETWFAILEELISVYGKVLPEQFLRVQVVASSLGATNPTPDAKTTETETLNICGTVVPRAEWGYYFQGTEGAARSPVKILSAFDQPNDKVSLLALGKLVAHSKAVRPQLEAFVEKFVLAL